MLAPSWMLLKKRRKKVFKINYYLADIFANLALV
jgi:hypothetical protein